ncbi:MAG: class I SAM-dependent methyltransferase [Deltaproteobacteria bacterium]|nr:MAG: class I SAM-dependent methyltransferase [Deltaproteobacteria bacterium]
MEAFRSGGGVSWAHYGPDMIEAQGDFNRPWLVGSFGTEILPAIPSIDSRLRADPPARVADVACGVGWASIAIARAYPNVKVDGFDLDELSIEMARQNARHGAAGRGSVLVAPDAAARWCRPGRGREDGRRVHGAGRRAGPAVLRVQRIHMSSRSHDGTSDRSARHRDAGGHDAARRLRGGLHGLRAPREARARHAPLLPVDALASRERPLGAVPPGRARFTLRHAPATVFHLRR